jgi:hypothetical protein
VFISGGMTFRQVLTMLLGQVEKRFLVSGEIFFCFASNSLSFGFYS